MKKEYIEIKTLDDLKNINHLYLLKVEDVSEYDTVERNVMRVEKLDVNHFDFAEFETIQNINGKETQRWKSIKYKKKTDPDWNYELLDGDNFCDTTIFADETKMFDWANKHYKKVYETDYYGYFINLDEFVENVKIEKPRKFVKFQYDLYTNLEKYNKKQGE